MAYKFKSTMYYSDEETKAFLLGKAVKTNGKRSESHYLYSLVTNEREGQHQADNEGKSQPASVQLFPEFTTSREFTVSGQITFWGLAHVVQPQEKESALMRLKHKSLMEAIELKIHEDVIKQDSFKREEQNEGYFLVVLKTYIACYYSGPCAQSGIYEGMFTATCRVIIVNRTLWDKHDGRFNFEKIRYIKYEDIAKAGRGIPGGLCKVAEISAKDKTGAFFIPVSTLPMKFPEKTNPGRVLIKGVDVSFHKERLKLKAMNETQKKRHSKKMLNFPG
ncbi:TPA: hypothetical protein PIV56_004260 [Klebsiella quasipneumoniae subsp. similipneumoniae]|nr:hypothetical protein [Enterobacter cloacae]HDH1767599.1 hypothetical protein [Klebsiella quasipneumoniae subsp. similipneumoniae]